MIKSSRNLTAFLLALAVCDAQTIFVDAGGAADTGYLGGMSYTIPLAIPAQTAPGINDQTVRYAIQFGYNVPVPAPGPYYLTLYFVEPTFQAAGQRVFTVTANNQTILTNLDLFAESGFLLPFSRTTLVYPTGSVLRLHFTASSGNAMVQAIGLTPMVATAAAPAVTPPVTTPLPVTPPPAWQADDFVATGGASAQRFTLHAVPSPQSILLIFVNGAVKVATPTAQFLNGVLASPIADYSIAGGNVLSFSQPLNAGDKVHAVYW